MEENILGKLLFNCLEFRCKIWPSTGKAGEVKTSALKFANTQDQDTESSSSDEWQKLNMRYDEFDVVVNDIDECKLELIGQTYGIANLSEGVFTSPAFPVDGHILHRNLRFMVPLVCKWAEKPNMPGVNVWFLVDTVSPFTCLTLKTMKAILDADIEIYEDSRFEIMIQDRNTIIQCQVSKTHFKEVNILGSDALRTFGLSGIEGIDWLRRTFRLSNQ